RAPGARAPRPRVHRLGPARRHRSGRDRLRRRALIRAPGAATEHPTSIAVLGFTDAFGNRGAALDDACATGLLLGGVRAVERQRVEAVLGEHEMSGDGEQSPEYYRRLGTMTGAEAFVMGSVSGGGVGTLVFRTRLVSATT